jgi:HK97 family phage major capsid protein
MSDSTVSGTDAYIARMAAREGVSESEIVTRMAGQGGSVIRSQRHDPSMRVETRSSGVGDDFESRAHAFHDRMFPTRSAAGPGSTARPSVEQRDVRSTRRESRDNPYSWSAGRSVPTDLDGINAELRASIDHFTAHPGTATDADRAHTARITANIKRATDAAVNRAKSSRIAGATGSAPNPTSHGDPDVDRAIARHHARRSGRPINPIGATVDELRGEALRIVERCSPHLSSTALDRIDRTLRENDGDGRMAKRWNVLEDPDYRSAFSKAMDPRHSGLGYNSPFSPAQNAALDRYREVMRDEIRAGSEAGSFGYAVPPSIDPTIVAASGDIAPLLGAANVVDCATDEYRPVAAPAAGWAWDGEGAVSPDSTPVMTQVTIPIYSVRGFVGVSDQLHADYPNSQAEFTKALNAGYLDAISLATAVGTGSGQPTGLFTAMAGITSNPSHVTVTTSGVCGFIDVTAAWDAVPARFQATSSWAMSSKVLSKIRSQGNALATQAVTVDPSTGAARIFGRPVCVSSYFPDFTGTTGSENFLVVGDLSGYTIPVRQGMSVELVANMRGPNGALIGSKGYSGTVRIGGNVTVPNALRLLSNS